MDGGLFEQKSEFKYLGVLNESDTDVAECIRKVASESKVAGAVRSLLMLGGVCGWSE